MTTRTVVRRIGATTVTEGGGVTVQRTIGLPVLRHLDPFLLLDQFGSDDPDEYTAGFPDHPHRGFVTLTYILDGQMEHRDSLGHQGNLHAGSAQWMKAAGGVIHSEMPRQTDAPMRGFQLWINLPSAEKMGRPEYREFPAERIPTVTAAGARVRILSGEFGGRRGPVEDPFTGVLYLDVSLPAGGRFMHGVESTDAAFVYPFEGTLSLDGLDADAGQLAVLGNGDTIDVAANGGASRFILVAGRPLHEPIVQYGPFVMNTREEIDEALADYRHGRLALGSTTGKR